MTADIWTFGPPEDDNTTYADGTTVPHRHQAVLLNGVKIGYVEIHMHKRRGRDRKTDVSFGITTCVYGPAPGGS
jgi:hypothetical protein